MKYVSKKYNQSIQSKNRVVKGKNNTSMNKTQISNLPDNSPDLQKKLA
jgi:hypothetical protein